jgi:hypothetical protein
LGYALWVTLKHLLKRRSAIVPKLLATEENAQPMTPMKAIGLLSTLQSADIVLPTTDGREIRLRRITLPSPHRSSNYCFGNLASGCPMAKYGRHLTLSKPRPTVPQRAANNLTISLQLVAPNRPC